MDGSTVAFSSEASEITMDGKVYKVSPLKMADRALAERRIRDRRISHMLERCRSVPLPDAVLGKAIADIECSSVSLDELLDTYESRIYLLWLSLKRGGMTITEQQVGELPPITMKMLGTIMRHITGVERDGGDEARPTTSTAGSSNESEAPSGANS